MKKDIGIYFIYWGILALLGGILFGCISSIQTIDSSLITILPFYKNRPLHVSLVVASLFLISVGGIYHYLPNYCGLKLNLPKIAKTHLFIFIITGFLIIFTYIIGIFGGREYWEFHPLFAIPIIFSWILLIINYFSTVSKKKEKFPVYMWMWGTGIIFFLFTYLESLLWIFPYFSDNIIKDLTIQWKAYGALVGSWNMLIYGTAIFLTEQISQDKKKATSNIAFFLYFLGLTNLMFGWAHHIYPVPTKIWIRNMSYIVNMSELLILGSIIWDWKKTLETAKKNRNILSYKYLIASEFWIFSNLIMALIISVPALNIFTHGTYVTVAHAMGSTIGINIMILLASVFFIFENISPMSIKMKKIVITGYYMVNLFLIFFWSSLILAGISKGFATVNGFSFYEIDVLIKPYLYIFMGSGLIIFLGFILILVPILYKNRLIFFGNKQNGLKIFSQE